MRILEITTFLRGGAGVFLTKLSKALKARGHDLFVISTKDVDNLCDWEELRQDLIRDEIPLSTFNFFKRDNDIFWSEVVRLKDFLIDNKIEVIHAHAGVPSYGCSIASKLAKVSIPIVATFHSWSKDRPNWMNVMDAYAFNHCDRVLFDSNAYMGIGVKKGIEAESTVVYPGILLDDEVLDRAIRTDNFKDTIRKQYSIPKECKLISNLGEVTSRKGQVDILRALNNVQDSIGDFRLIIIGQLDDTSYVDALKAEALRLGVEDRLILTGWASNPYEIVASSDLFVFPTYSEGLGMAIVEAMALAVPTIFSLVEGTNDIYNEIGDNGFGCFQPGDITEMSRLIVAYLNLDIMNRKSKTDILKKIVSERFSFARTVESYEGILYEEIQRRNI